MADIGNRRLIDLCEDDLGALIKKEVTRALDARERQQLAPLVDSLEAGLLLGMRPRMPPRPEDPAAAACWQKEHDVKIRRAVWGRIDRARQGKGDARILAALAEGQSEDRLLFVRARLEAYIAELAAPSKQRPKLRSLGGDRG